MNKTTITIIIILILSLPITVAIQTGQKQIDTIPTQVTRDTPNKCEYVGKCNKDCSKVGLFGGYVPQSNYICKDTTEKCCVKETDDLLTCDQECAAMTCTCKVDCYEKYSHQDGAKKSGETVNTGQTCGGYDLAKDDPTKKETQKCPGNVYSMSVEEQDKYKLQGCPAGCFFFNHPGCMSTKGLGNAAWDLLLLNDGLKKWNDQWMAYWDAWGAKFDPMTYIEENVCSTEGKWAKLGVGLSNTAPEGILGGEAYASAVAMRQTYNYTNTTTKQVDLYLYTVTWRIGGLSADNNYSLWVAQSANMETPLRIAPVRSEWFNLSAGEAHGGYKASKVLFMRRNFSYVCIQVQVPICDYCTESGINTCEPTKARQCFASDSAYWSLPGNTFKGEEYTCNHCKNYACVPIKNEEEYYADRGEPVGGASVTTTSAAAGTGSTSLDDEFALLNPEPAATTP